MFNLAKALYNGLLLLGYESTMVPDYLMDKNYYMLKLNKHHSILINTLTSVYSTTIPNNYAHKNIEKGTLAYIHTLVSNLPDDKITNHSFKARN